MGAAARLASLPLKAGQDAPLPARRPPAHGVVLGSAFTGMQILEVGVCLHNIAHHVGVFFPVGSKAPDSAGFEHARNLVGKSGGDQAAFVVA